MAPLVPTDPSEVPRLLEAAQAFVAEALEDDLNCVLVACSKGASRSVAVVLAHIMVTEGLGLEQAFDKIAALRWRIWPSAMLVEALLALESKWVAAGGTGPQRPSLRERICRKVGTHAALATARHNGVPAEPAAAEAAWSETLKEGGGLTGAELEATFAECKRRVMGLARLDLAAFSDRAGQLRDPPHAKASELEDGLLLCGLGGLVEQQVHELLAQHNVVQALVCGRPGRDAHVAALQAAAGSRGMARDATHVVPIADNAGEDLLGHLEAAVAFVRAAVAGRGSGKVLVACRQGASRSASVVLAYAMSERGCSALDAFRSAVAARWRLWPNAGFVVQLLRLQDTLRARRKEPTASEAERLETLRTIGVHAAWAANRQNLEETGFGRQGLTLEEVEGLWDQAATESASPEEQFEKCKALALGVDLSAFEDGPPAAKRARE